MAPVVANPVISPVDGSYTGTVIVSISCATDGAAIQFTQNGGTPDALSDVYQDPIAV